MKYCILKAQAKKNKFYNKNTSHHVNSDDEALSSDNEEDISSFVGEILNNRYICLKYIGKGTFAKVWLIYDVLDDNLKVAKHYNSENLEESKNEVKILNKLKEENNPNLIKFYEYFSYEKYGSMNSVVIFEQLGVSLLDFLNDINNIMEEEDSEYITKINIKYIKKIIKDVLNGLKSIHSCNIIHADLKPDNILFDIKPYKINAISKFVDTLNLQEKYENIYNEILPERIHDVDKNKRKIIKKKCKIKTIQSLRDFLIEKVKIYSANYEQNIDNVLTDFKYNIDDIFNCNFTCKIIDFGNCEFENSISQEELYLKAYRPPENITTLNYNTKADIWVLGCMFYELFTGEELFQIDKTLRKNDQDKNHLLQMFKIVGNMNVDLIDNSDFYDDFFDYYGKLKINKKEKLRGKTYDSLEEHLFNKSIIKDKDIVLKSLDFLKLFFEYNINMRMNCETLLLQEYLN